MKKSLMVLAIAGAFSGAAFAQSSVTLFGIADTGVTWVKGDGNGRIIGLSNSGLNSSRIGVRGTEDLGGGLKANFWFEAGVNTDNGTGAGSNTNNQLAGGTATAGSSTNYAAGATLPNGTVCAPVAPATTCAFAGVAQPVTTSGTQGLTFNRRMFVGLSGGFGELRFGRNYTPFFMQTTSNDPFGTNGIGQTLLEVISTNGLLAGTAAGSAGSSFVATTVRASNAIEYLTPSGIGGVYVHGMYAFGENASTAVNKQDGNTWSARAGWAGGPADISLAYTHTSYLQQSTAIPIGAAAASPVGNYTVYGIGGTLTFGAFKPMFQVAKHKLDIAGADLGRTDFLLGLVATFGSTDLRASINKYNVKNSSNDALQLAVGPVFNLSKRTAIYGTVAYLDNKSTGTGFGLATTGVGARLPTTAGGKSEGLEVGVRHSF